MTVDGLIRKYGLLPHPEGGYYRETHRSGLTVHSGAVDAERAAVTDIYFLLARGQVSRFHRVAHDEIWHFYAGAPLRLLEFDGETVREIRLGPEDGFKHVVRGGLWQAAEPLGEFSLCGCTVAPGFDFRDFQFLADNAAPATAPALTEFRRFV